jgi:hypothetical protein
MTGYSQALQAELDPQGRVAMGEKIADNLGLLLDHPQLSLGFRQVLFGLQQRWLAMSECTRSAAQGAQPASPRKTATTLPAVWPVAAPKRLQ